jgi:hypothetical protein
MEKFKNSEEYNKYQEEWLLLNLIRELRGIATKGNLPTYTESIKFARQVIPDIFDENSEMVKKHHEPELVRFYLQLAEAQSKLEGRKISGLELVDKEIMELNKMLASDIAEKDTLNKKLKKLKTVRTILKPTKEEEDFILAHDVRSLRFGVMPVNHSGKYADYKVTENRIVRVRLIHPNRGERSLGADMIYEHYDPEKEMVRFVMIQYKLWDGNRLYWTTSRNLKSQLEKLSENLCDQKFCFSSPGRNASGEFRYPFCTAFLRPTDTLLYKNSPLTSSGTHLPICKISEIIRKTSLFNNVLDKHALREVSVSQPVFEECFNKNQLGSRWMSYDEAEELYRKHKILDSEENIIIHVQELEL